MHANDETDNGSHQPRTPTDHGSIDPATLVFIGAKKWLSAVDSLTGRPVWKTEIPGSWIGSAGFMTVTADPFGVYACRGGRVTCVDPVTGTILWSIKAPHAGSSLPVVATLLSGLGGASQQAQVAAASAVKKSSNPTSGQGGAD